MKIFEPRLKQCWKWTVRAAVIALCPTLHTWAGESLQASYQDLELSLSANNAIAQDGKPVELVVNLMNKGKRDIELPWVCTCQPDRPGQSHDYFRFQIKQGDFKKEEPACDHSTETLRCRKCQPVLATLEIGKTLSFTWKLDLAKLVGSKTGSFEVVVFYDLAGSPTPPLRSAPISLSVGPAK